MHPDNPPSSNAGSDDVRVVLAACPFCGGEASDAGHIRYSRPLTDTWWEDGTPITETFQVNCMKCGAASRSGICNGYQTRVKAIAAWNTRATPSNQSAARAEGLVLVPREPTPAMIEACGIADATTWGSVGGMYRAMWAAMLAAADLPSPTGDA